MKNSNKVLTLAFVTVMLLLVSCGGGNDNMTESNGNGTGSMNFSLIFEAPTGAAQQAQSTQRTKQLPPSSISPTALTGNVCTDYGLSTITGGVYNAANALIATGGPWPCSAHQGTFNNIPVGSGYKVVFEADVSGTIAWRGQTTGQSIISGQATTLPPIVMNYIGSDTVPPTVNSVTPVATSTNVPVTSAITATFSEDMLALLVDVATFTLYNGATPVLGTVSYDVVTKTGTFRPSANLAYATSYTATIVGGVAGVKDKALNNMLSNYTWTFTTEAAPVAPDLTSGLIAHFPFNGDANDASGNNNNGTVSGATLTTDRYGNANSAYNFNGTNSYITVPNSATLNPSAITISLWVYLNQNAPYWGTALSEKDSFVAGQTGFGLLLGGWTNNNTVRFEIYNPSLQSIDSPAGLSLNRWYFVTAIFDGSKLDIYIDGELVASKAASGSISSGNNGILGMGARFDDSGVRTGDIFFSGKIDQYKIFNRALSAAEVQGLYQLPAPDTWQTMSTTGAPAARGYHSAVWTGSEMIIWGGYLISNDQTNTGGRYNPVTDSWGTPTSTVGAPVARGDHTAVWTGSKMIVWGGDSGASIHYNDGGRYNPATDSWSATPPTTTGAPLARSAHSAVWTGNEMIIWGGHTGTAATNDGGRYNPITNTWNSTAISTTGAPIIRYYHSAVWTGTEMIVWGGHDNGTAVINDGGGRYNPTSNTWSSSTPTTVNATSARFGHTAVWTGTEMLVWAGTLDGGSIFYNNGGRYNPVSNTWTTASPTTTGAPSVRCYHAACWTGSQMLVWGGVNGAASYLANGGRYAP